MDVVLSTKTNNRRVVVPPTADAPPSPGATSVRWRLAVATIERQRILHGFTRDALARAARIDPKTVRDALNERRRPTLGTVDRIARTLDLTLADVLVLEDRRAIEHRFRPRPPTTLHSPIEAVEQLQFLN